MNNLWSLLLPLLIAFESARAVAGPGSIPILEVRKMLATIPLESGCKISRIRMYEKPYRLLFRIAQGDRVIDVRLPETPVNQDFQSSTTCSDEDLTWRLRLDGADRITHWVWAIDRDLRRTREFSLTVEGKDGSETFDCD